MKTNVRTVAAAAVIGAAYAVLTAALSPISYGPVQFRVSECLCILPFFLPGTVWGLFIGCALANIFTGNVFDVIFGSLSTLAAGLITARAGRLKPGFGSRFLGCSAPLVINALVIGAVLCKAYGGFDPLEDPGAYAVYAGQIALGEGAVMYLLGLPLMRYLPGNKYFRDFINNCGS